MAAAPPPGGGGAPGASPAQETGLVPGGEESGQIQIPHTAYIETMGHVEPEPHCSPPGKPGAPGDPPPGGGGIGRIGPSAKTGFEATAAYTGRPLALVTVGLPGRGKTYISRRICRFLNWLGLQASVFVVEAYRKKTQDDQGIQTNDGVFYDPANKPAMEKRDQICMTALGDMVRWMRAGGKVGILDGQNVKASRRAQIHSELAQTLDDDRIIFLEVDESDDAALKRYRDLTIERSWAFEGIPREEATRRFEDIQDHYKRAREPLTENYCFLRMLDGGTDVQLNRIHGYVPCRIANFLLNVNLSMQPILMSRHGQSEYNELGRIGGDSGLSRFGERYAEALSAWLDANAPAGLEVWCSTLLRTRMTVTPLKGKWPIIYWRPLEEIDAGICDGMTYEEIEEQLPDEFAKRKKEKYWYRYPHGESYHDLVVRLEPVIMELERAKKPVLIVAHQAVLRVIYAYIADRLPEHCTRLSMPLHTVVKVEPTYDGAFSEERFPVLPTDPAVANVGTDGRADVLNAQVF